MAEITSCERYPIPHLELNVWNILVCDGWVSSSFLTASETERATSLPSQAWFTQCHPNAILSENNSTHLKMTARARALHLKHQEQHLQYKDPRPPPNSPPPSILSNFKCQWGPPRLVWSASPSGYDLSRYPKVMWWVVHFIFFQSVLWETP